MTTQKSIDGLSTRAAKTASSKGPKTKKSITVNSASTTSTTSTKTTTTATKSVKKSPAKKVAKKPISQADITEEFVSAPTTNIWDTINVEDNTTVEETENPETTDEPDEPEEEETLDTLEADFIEEPEEDDSSASFLKPVQAFDFDEEEGLTESKETVEELRGKTDKSPEDEDEDEEEDPKKSKKELKKAKKLAKKAKKQPSKKRRIASIVALVIVLILIGVVIWAIFWGNDLIAKLTGGRGNLLDLFSLNSETYEPLRTDENGRTNILAFGTGGYDMSGEEGGGVHDGAQLTDSIMLISFDQKTGDVAMISLPRDLKGPSTCTSTGKINEVYWCNGGNGDISLEEENAAATALMEAVGYVLGVEIQYYAHLNWGSLASIVDILGGITVTLDENILDYEYTEAVYEAGKPYTIDGAAAVGLARARHGTTGGDFSRGASQQKIIIGIKDRIFEKQLSIADLLGLVTTLGDNLRTNFSLSEMKTLAHDAQILDFDSMRQISLYPDYMTTGYLNGISYVLPIGGAGNYTAIHTYLAKQLSSDPRDYEEPTIAIYNATDTPGLAGEERTKLQEKGYTITTIDNAPAGEYPSGTTIYAIGNKPGTKNLLETDYNLYTLEASALPATIAPNYDFIIILNN